jgi:signal transduction histidine kinase
LEQEVQHLRDYLQIFKYMMDMIAHDLSTPVTLLSGYLDLLQLQQPFTPESEAGGYVKIMTSMVDRLMLLINDLADLSQAEAGKLQLNLQLTDIEALVRELALEFRLHLLAKRQVLKIELDEQLPLIPCDVPRFAQIINNLFSNASKYSPEASEIYVKINLTAEGDFLQILIRDTGAGIASTDLENIFKRHYRTAEAERSSVRGAGLGLYIVRLLIELHGGKIWCESTPGVGSTFYFTLPTTSDFLEQPVYSDSIEQAYLYQPTASTSLSYQHNPTT